MPPAWPLPRPSGKERSAWRIVHRLWEEKFREKHEKLQAYLESYGWRALDAE